MLLKIINGGQILSITEIECAALNWLPSFGYIIIRGPDCVLGEPAAERESFMKVMLCRRLHAVPHPGHGQCQVRGTGDMAMRPDHKRLLCAEP